MLIKSASGKIEWSRKGPEEMEEGGKRRRKGEEEAEKEKWSTKIREEKRGKIKK